MTRRVRWAWVLVVIAPLGTVAATSGSAAQGAPPELEPVPRPVDGAVEETAARELEAAHRQVEEMVAEPSKSEEARARKASGYAELGRLYVAYGLWGPARAALANAVELEPSAADRRRWVHLLGYVLERQGELEAAAERYADAVELAPRASAPKVRLARTLLELDRRDEARRLFEELVERDASAAVAHFGLGRLAARRGDSGAAVKHFEQTLSLQPGATQVHYPLAQAYRRLGDLESAREHLRAHAAGGDEPGRVRFPDPLVDGLGEAAGGAAVHKLRGDQALLAGDTTGAAAAYRRAVEADPESFWARKSLALTLHELGRADEAERHLEAALGLDPGLGEAGARRERARLVFALGGIAANRGRRGEALERFRRAAELNPDDAEVHVQLGNLHGRAGRLEDALAAFGRALELEPDLPEARLQRATTLMDLGRFDEAVPELERYLELEPGDERARGLLETARGRAGG